MRKLMCLALSLSVMLIACASTGGHGAKGIAPDAAELGQPLSKWYVEVTNPEGSGTMIIQSTLTLFSRYALYERTLEFRSADPMENEKSSMREYGTLSVDGEWIWVDFPGMGVSFEARQVGETLEVTWPDASPDDGPEVYTSVSL